MNSCFRRLHVVLALIASFALLAAPAHATEPGGPGDPEIEALLLEQLEAVPGGVVEGNRVVYPDGSYFAAVDADTYSIGQCDSGYFCGWARDSYNGSFFAVSGSGVTKSLTWSTRSYRNRRSTIAKLFNSAGTASTCFAAGESRATIGSAYHTPAKVRLAASGSC